MGVTGGRGTAGAGPGRDLLYWVLHTTHSSRSLLRRAAFKKFCLQMPGHDLGLD